MRAAVSCREKAKRVSVEREKYKPPLLNFNLNTNLYYTNFNVINTSLLS
jgi:hypothetical protein